jgi:hypothetical protein
MPITPTSSYTVGPGVLALGAVGTSVDWSAQVKGCKVTPKVNAEDNVNVLSGGQLAGERTYDWSLSATVVQDLSDDGNVEWSWEHAGEEVPFTFTPSTAMGKSVTGTLIVDPLELGGDAKTKPTSDLEFSIVGTPALGADL